MSLTSLLFAKPQSGLPIVIANEVVCILWCVLLLPSLPRMVDCDTFTPALWKLLAMSLTFFLGFFLTALTMFCYQQPMFSFVYQFDICC